MTQADGIGLMPGMFFLLADGLHHSRERLRHRPSPARAYRWKRYFLVARCGSNEPYAPLKVLTLAEPRY